jgi:hypothetical protein
MAQEAQTRHPGQQAALPQDQWGMQVANDRPVDLRQPIRYVPALQQKWKGCRIVAEQQNSVLGLQFAKGGGDLVQMCATKFTPLRQLVGQRF